MPTQAETHLGIAGAVERLAGPLSGMQSLPAFPRAATLHGTASMILPVSSRGDGLCRPSLLLEMRKWEENQTSLERETGSYPLVRSVAGQEERAPFFSFLDGYE